MTSLQIRNLPDDLYQALSYRAARAHRSLAQQTVVELREAIGHHGATQRHQVLSRIQQDIQENGVHKPALAPERMLREDRER